MSDNMDTLRAKLDETEALARELFEQQFIRCGGRMPADPEWGDLEQVERDDWWDRALDAGPLIGRERSSRQAWATEALRLQYAIDFVLEHYDGPAPRLLRSMLAMSDTEKQADAVSDGNATSGSVLPNTGGEQ